MLDIFSTWIWGVLFFFIHGRYIIDRSPSTTVHCQLDTSPDISERPEKRLVPELSRYEAQALTEMPLRWRSNKLGMKYHEEIRWKKFSWKKWIYSPKLGFNQHPNVDLTINFDGVMSAWNVWMSAWKIEISPANPLKHQWVAVNRGCPETGNFRCNVHGEKGD